MIELVIELSYFPEDLLITESNNRPKTELVCLDHH